MMNQELKKFEKLLLGTTLPQISNLIEDEEAKGYFGYNFQTEKLDFKFRKAKITPKKVGQFVTLWKRNSQKETEPFNNNLGFIIRKNEEKQNVRADIFVVPYAHFYTSIEQGHATNERFEMLESDTENNWVEITEKKNDFKEIKGKFHSHLLKQVQA